jgi:hypothetical protein
MSACETARRMNHSQIKKVFIVLPKMLVQFNMVFNKVAISSSMQVIFRGTYGTRTWAIFQKEGKLRLLLTGCRLIETRTMVMFTSHGW